MLLEFYILTVLNISPPCTALEHLMMQVHIAVYAHQISVQVLYRNLPIYHVNVNSNKIPMDIQIQYISFKIYVPLQKNTKKEVHLQFLFA